MLNIVTWLDKAQRSPLRLWLLNRILARVIPFNAPHGIIMPLMG